MVIMSNSREFMAIANQRARAYLTKTSYVLTQSTYVQNHDLAGGRPPAPEEDDTRQNRTIGTFQMMGSGRL